MNEWRNPEPQMADFAAMLRANFVQNFAVQLQERFRVIEQTDACGGKLCLSRSPEKQGHMKGIFECSDAHADGRLSDKFSLRGERKAALFCYREEVPEMAQIDVFLHKVGSGSFRNLGKKTVQNRKSR